MGEIAKTVANGLGSHRVVGVIPEKLNTVGGHLETVMGHFQEARHPRLTKTSIAGVWRAHRRIGSCKGHAYAEGESHTSSLHSVPSTSAGFAGSRCKNRIIDGQPLHTCEVYHMDHHKVKAYCTDLAFMVSIASKFCCRQ